jgi:desampylase
MTFEISSELRATLLWHAQQAPGKEVCGLLLGEGQTVQHILPAANVAADPARQFEIDPAVLITAHRNARDGGPAIIGCYHSHPNGRVEPSAEDRAMMLEPGWLWLIIANAAVLGWQVKAPKDCEEVHLRVV